jgi:hypothetical protein
VLCPLPLHIMSTRHPCPARNCLSRVDSICRALLSYSRSSTGNEHLCRNCNSQNYAAIMNSMLLFANVHYILVWRSLGACVVFNRHCNVAFVVRLKDASGRSARKCGPSWDCLCLNHMHPLFKSLNLAIAECCSAFLLLRVCGPDNAWTPHLSRVIK